MPGGWRAAAAAGLLALMALQLTRGLRGDGLTNDEGLYMASGWLQLTRGDHRLNEAHPPLGPALAALGLLPLRPRAAALGAGEDPLAYTFRFVHVDNDARRLIACARTPVVLATLALALLAAAWARAAGGATAGLMALALAAFHPTLLAHGHLATTDVPAALGMLATSYCFWAWCRRPGAAWAAATAAALGLALAARLTAWALAPCLAALALARIMRTPADGRAAAVAETARLAAVLAVSVPLVIWAVYGFRGPAEFLLPAHYVESVRFQLGHNRRGHLAYLLGERSRRGWPHYFAVALAVKSTPGFLAAVALGAAAWRRLLPSAREAAVHALLPAAVTFASVSAGNIQIGERYLLPVHAYLIPVAAGGLAAWVHGRRRWAGVAVAALAGHAASGAAAGLGPGHLAYFNALAGGASGGHRVLLDSNLDWGQDLPRLAEWMRRNRVPSVQLAYMGSDDPARFGIAREDLPGRRQHSERTAGQPFTGTVVASPNLVYGLVPALASTYEPLRHRPPDDRAGVFFVYRLGGPGAAQR